MKRYVLITNIWGRVADKYQGWNQKCLSSNKLVIDKERTEFDTMEEVKEHLALFQEYCSTFIKATRKDRYLRKRDEWWKFDSPNTKVWGWLLGDRETMNMVWGGEKLYNYDSRTDKRVLKDILFRGPDEVPEGYKWDVGEYEGWLQFRWGDGKNAVGYVEKNTPKNTTHHNESLEDDYDHEEYEDWGDTVEDEYIRKETKELEKRLEDRW